MSVQNISASFDMCYERDDKLKTSAKRPKSIPVIRPLAFCGGKFKTPRVKVEESAKIHGNTEHM